MTTRIRCREHRCVFNKRGICTSDEIEYDPDAGCLTMELRESADAESEKEKQVNDEELEEELEEEFGDDDEEDDDDWDEDEDQEKGQDSQWSGRRKTARRR